MKCSLHLSSKSAHPQRQFPRVVAPQILKRKNARCALSIYLLGLRGGGSRLPGLRCKSGGRSVCSLRGGDGLFFSSLSGFFFNI